MSEPLTLTDETIEAVARRVAELLDASSADQSAVPNRITDLVDAAEVARRFSLSRDYIYSHADELGVVRLGTGPRARLRFDPERVLEALAPRPFSPAEPTRKRPRHRATVALLPIGGGK